MGVTVNLDNVHETSSCNGAATESAENNFKMAETIVTAFYPEYQRRTTKKTGQPISY